MNVSDASGLHFDISFKVGLDAVCKLLQQICNMVRNMTQMCQILHGHPSS